MDVSVTVMALPSYVTQMLEK